MHVDSAESAGGRLGAVLAAPRSGVVASAARSVADHDARSGPEVLTDVTSFDFPGDVSRSGDLSGSRGDTRSGHLTFDALAPTRWPAGWPSSRGVGRGPR